MRPRGLLGYKRHAFLRQRMRERDTQSVQAERSITRGERLGLADFTIGQIGGVAEDGEAEMPEMDANLIGAAGERTCFE